MAAEAKVANDSPALHPSRCRRLTEAQRTGRIDLVPVSATGTYYTTSPGASHGEMDADKSWNRNDRAKTGGCRVCAIGLTCKEKPGWKQNGTHQDDRDRTLPHPAHRHALRQHAWRDQGVRTHHLPRPRCRW